MRFFDRVAACSWFVGMATTAVLFGGLALLLFMGFTWGALGAPLFGLALMAPIILANYLLWGRRYSRWLQRRGSVDGE